MNSAQLLSLRNAQNQDEDTASAIPFDFVPNSSQLQTQPEPESQLQAETPKTTSITPLQILFLNGMDKDEIEKLNTVLARYVLSFNFTFYFNEQDFTNAKQPTL